MNQLIQGMRQYREEAEREERWQRRGAVGRLILAIVLVIWTYSCSMSPIPTVQAKDETDPVLQELIRAGYSQDCPLYKAAHMRAKREVIDGR